MTILNTRCERCRQQLNLPTSAVLLVRGTTAAGDADPTIGPTAWLVCTGCDDLVGLQVPAVLAVALERAGCHVLLPPQQPVCLESRPAGPPLCRDDLLTLHELLADDVALAAALRRLATIGC
jgi:hypothetical protein